MSHDVDENELAPVTVQSTPSNDQMQNVLMVAGVGPIWNDDNERLPMLSKIEVVKVPCAIDDDDMSQRLVTTQRCRTIGCDVNG